MKSRGLTISAVVLAALAGGLYWSNKHPQSEAAKASDTPPQILKYNEADIRGITIHKGDTETALTRKDGKWEMTAPKPLGVDQDAASQMVTTLASLNSDRLLEDRASDLAQFGLDKPKLEVDVTDKGGKTRKLLVGEDNPTGNSAYAKLANDPRVFLIASYTKTSLDKGPQDLRDKRLLTFDQDKVSRVELNGKKGAIEFGRAKDEWQIVKPRPLRADGLQVDELVRKLKDAKMDTSQSADDASKASAAFTSGTPVAVARVTDAAGTQELQVRKSKDDYYAKSSVVDGVYKVPNDLGQALDKNLDDFRNKKLFDFGWNDPNKVEMHNGAKYYGFVKGGEDWWANGKKMDVTSVQSFLDKVRDLSASKFVDSGFTTPVLDLTVTSNDNKRVEKVLVAKSGDNYVAKRDGEPALYQIDAKTVTDLEQAAGDVKPAVVAKKK